MTKQQHLRKKERNKLLRYLPYPILGLLVFCANSQLDLNYFVKGYLSLLELQLGMLAVYFISQRLRKNKIAGTESPRDKMNLDT